MEESESKPTHKQSSSLLTKEQRQFNEEISLSNKWISMYEREKKKSTDLNLLTKIHLKWTTDLNVRYKVIKLLENNTGQNLGNLTFDD